MSTASVARLDIATTVDRIIAETGGDIRIGLPLGLGKPNRLINALYRAAKERPDIRLQIFTALSLGRPRAGSDLERRFLDPFVERVFAGYEELDYLADVRRDRVPDNVRVHEFFFQPGSLLGSGHAQRHYISSNYSHAARDIAARGINVAAQLVAPHPDVTDRVSLSCNPEVTLDLLPLLAARRAAGERILLIGQLHRALPYMLNDAEVDAADFDILIDEPEAESRLFPTPNMPVSMQDHFIGLNGSRLLRDGGMIQIGIGALGDALVHHALLRQHDNALYRRLVEAVSLPDDGWVDAVGGRDPFRQGLYGCSEMVTAGLVGLMDGGVIRRPVLDDPELMRLLEAGRIAEQISLHTLDVLMEADVITAAPNQRMLDWLARRRILRAPVRREDDMLVLPDGTRLANDLCDRDTREGLVPWLGDHLDTILLHGGFLLGPGALYRRLAGMSEAERRRINLTRISFVNELYGDEELKRMQRRDARFINTAFTATLMGAAVSDQLEDGRVLSGVGGQYNFVVQGHALAGARSILVLRAWREKGGVASSNIVWQYGHTTIPRHLRDIFVTEYGIADLRGRTDAECIAAMLNIADSRFQDALLAAARAAGKISADYRIPEPFRYNLPERLAEIHRRHPDCFPAFPLGCDFQPVERDLLAALGWLRARVSQKEFLRLGRDALGDTDILAERFHAHLARMQLEQPQGIRERLYRRLVLTALAATVGDTGDA